MTYQEFYFYWSLFELLNGAVVSIPAVIAVYGLAKHRKDKAPIRFWALRESASRNEFIVLSIAAMLMVVLSVVFAYGTYVSSYTLEMLGELIGTVDYLMVSVVIVIWAREFIRFI
jgi:hypothetical protein